MTEGTTGSITSAAADAGGTAPAAEAQGKMPDFALSEIRKIAEQRDGAKKERDALKAQLADLQAKNEDSIKAVQSQLDTLKSQSEEREKRLRAVADQALAAVPEKIRAIAAKSAPEDALELVRAWQEETRNQPGPAAHPAAASPGYAGKTIEQIAALGGDAVTDYLRGLTPQERRKAIDEVWRKYG